MRAKSLTPEPNPAPGFAERPDKSITIEPQPGTVTVTADGLLLASTTAALSLVEDGYPPVLYIPFTDIDFRHLSRTGTQTHCPFKGDATYWQIGLPGDAGTDVMWSYETPFDEMEAIKGHGAFIADRVQVSAGDVPEPDDKENV